MTHCLLRSFVFLGFQFSTGSLLKSYFFIYSFSNQFLAYDLGWHNFVADAVFGWHMAIICWFFLQKCSIYYINGSMGILVSGITTLFIGTSYVIVIQPVVYQRLPFWKVNFPVDISFILN